MSDQAVFWADERLVYTVAIAAVLSLLATIWLFRRRRRSGRQAGVICLMLSIGLHLALLLLVPYASEPNGGSPTVDAQSDDIGVDTVEFTTFDPDMIAADAAGDDADSRSTPLPVSDLTDLLDQATEPTEIPEAEIDDPAGVETASISDQVESASELSDDVPESLAESGDLSPPIRHGHRQSVGRMVAINQQRSVKRGSRSIRR